MTLRAKMNEVFAPAGLASQVLESGIKTLIISFCFFCFQVDDEDENNAGKLKHFTLPVLREWYQMKNKEVSANISVHSRHHID